MVKASSMRWYGHVLRIWEEWKHSNKNFKT